MIFENRQTALVVSLLLFSCALCVLFLLCALFAGCSESRLDTALEEESLTKAKMILAFRSNLIGLEDEDGRTRLHKAAMRNKKKIVELLIAKGADVNAADRYGFTALHYASQRGHAETAGMLIEKGADVEAKNHYFYTPLHLAAIRGHAEVAGMLMSHNANAFAKDKNGRIPTQIAFEKDHIRVSNLLLPLHAAAKTGNLEQVRSLLEKYPESINHKDPLGRTPLHAAIRYDQASVVELLIETGADQNALDDYGYTPEYYSAEKRLERTGIDSIKPSVEEDIDRITYDMLSKYEYINVALVYNGEIVFTKSYGSGRLHSDDVWGSVSKPVTAMMVLHLLSTGVIESLDDPIWKYSSRYNNCMPEQFADDSVTIKHLLVHKSGVPHNDKPTWKDGKLNLLFKPGSRDQYSTPGYGILGHIIEDITGKSYSDAVKAYIGKPISAPSFWAEEHFRAPGGRVHSTVRDMALFSIGVMNHVYVPSDLFYQTMIQYHNGPAGMGWGIMDLGSPDLIIFHGGSNGRPQAMLLIKPRKKLSICILGRAKELTFELDGLAFRLLSGLENSMASVATADTQ